MNTIEGGVSMANIASFEEFKKEDEGKITQS